MYSDMWKDIEIELATNRGCIEPVMGITVYTEKGFRQQKNFYLPFPKGEEIIHLLSVNRVSDAVNTAMRYHEQWVFETRPLSDRIIEKIESGGETIRYNVTSVFRTLLVWGPEAKLEIPNHDVDLFINVLLALDDDEILSIHSIGKSKLETIHKIQGVLRNNDREYFVKNCPSIY